MTVDIAMVDFSFETDLEKKIKKIDQSIMTSIDYDEPPLSSILWR